MKLLTVVIPTYNTERYLERCLDSLLTEEVLRELEVLVVNDGSKDGSLAIAQAYAKRYPRSSSREGQILPRARQRRLV